jgi:hypothetical protein
MHTTAAIRKIAARFRDHREVEHVLRVVRLIQHFPQSRFAFRNAIQSRRHRQQIANCDFFFARIFVGNFHFAEKLQRLLVYAFNFFLLNRHSDQRPRNAFRDRSQIVRSLAVVWIKVRFSHNEIISDNEEAVNIHAGFTCCFDSLGEYGRVNPLRFRRRRTPARSRPIARLRNGGEGKKYAEKKRSADAFEHVDDPFLGELKIEKIEEELIVFRKNYLFNRIGWRFIFSLKIEREN